MMIKKSLSLLLALMLIVASIPLTAVSVSAADGDTLTVTAKSNIAPDFTQSFDPDTEQITVTWWIQSEETMMNAQWIMKYDNTVLKVDETPGVNMTFDEDGSVEENMIFRAANGVNSFITMSPKNISGSGIGGSASNWPTGYPLVAEDGVSKIPFISVTFNPVEGATGETVVELEMQIMQIKGSNDYLDYDFIRYSAIVDETIQYLPEIPVAVYAGPIDPDYLPGQPSTVVPTEEPTTVPATELPTEPPTEEPTTAEPYTEPYTEPPTEPYTEPYTEPPTEESTTVPDVTAGGTSGYCTWRLEGGTLTISGDRRMENYDNAPWYKYRDNIYHIVIDYGVTDIGERAFADCCNAVSVTIPRSVTTIRAESFYNCTGLQDVTIPDTVTYIGNHAFNKCTGLQSVTIPDSVLTIGNSAFYRCAGLQSVTLPDRLTHIDDYTFFFCTSLQSVTIPDGVTSIGNLAFYNCTGLQSVTIPTGVTRIGYQAFFNCPGLQSVTIPGTVMNIRNNAFGYDKNYNRVPGFTIYGYTGTDAERYANEFGFVFVSSGEFHYTPDFSCVTIAGTGSASFLYGESWDPTSELNRMTKVSTGVYEITYFGVNDGFDYQLEFVANTNWDLSWGCVPEDGFASGITKSAVWNSQSIPFTPKLGTLTVDVRITFDIKDWNNPTYRIDIVPQGESFDIYNHNFPDRLIISKTPDKIRYFPGEAFDPTGMIVTAVFNDGTEQQVTDYTLIPMEAQGSVQQLIVSWRDKTTLLTIFVFALGDVNMDGAVTITDVTLIQKALVELTALDESERQLADFNQDGEISIADATLIQIQISQ